MARTTGIPAIFWEVLWLALGILAVAQAVKQLVWW